MNAIALYGRYVMASIRMQMAYPASFAMLSLGSFLVTVVEFIGVWALFRRFGQVGGWRLGEVALFYGLVSVIFASFLSWAMPVTSCRSMLISSICSSPTIRVPGLSSNDESTCSAML